MSLSDFQSVQIEVFKGPWLRDGITDAPLGVALLSLNAEYNLGQVSKRLGFSSAFATTDSINSIYNWIKSPDAVSAAGNLLIYYSGNLGAVRIIADMTSFTASTLYSASAHAASVANSGTRLFIALFNAGPTGAAQCRVVGVLTGAVTVDKAFLGPMTVLPVLANGGAGKVTAGNHRIGYIITTRSGFEGKISPVDGNGVFNITSAIGGGGSVTINVAITATWPAEAVSIQLVATPSTNLNRYFRVPFQTAAVTGGGSSTVNLVFNISDSDLLSQATECTNNAGLLTQDSGGAGPFSPHFVFEYGHRIGYITDSATSAGTVSICYFSDIEAHQSITASKHGITLPGFRKICCAFVVRNVCYLLGPDWTYSVQDTLSSFPVQWPDPHLVDGQIGTVCPLGVTVNAAGGFAWVVSKRGLEMFSAGQYGEIPMSFYVDNDWRRINWAVADRIQIVDDQVKQRVMITVPLDGSTVPSHIMYFSYQNGLTPEALCEGYSLWSINVPYFPGAIALVRNPTSLVREVWIGPSDTVNLARVLRYNNPGDANVQQDYTTEVAFAWESALLPPITTQPGRVYNAKAVTLSAKGADTQVGGRNGYLDLTIFSMDKKASNFMKKIVLGSGPGTEYTRLARKGFESQGFSVRVEEGTLDGGVTLSLMGFYFAPKQLKAKSD